MFTKINYFFCVGLLLCLSVVATAQELQSPEQFLGYPLGSRYTQHHQVTAYFEYLASKKTNFKLVQYGKTNEMRPLLAAFISSPANMGKLEEIRQNNLKITGLQEGQASTAAAPAIVWLSYGVHGDESSSTEASLQTAYELLQPKNAKWLENTVVVIDPCLNPDGRDRYVHWYMQMQGVEPNANPEAKEHNQDLRRGRPNHYVFDLNRDWAWQTQVETQQRVVLYQQWMPHIHADFHEMGVESSYYFAPAAEPYHSEITPFQRSFQFDIGKNHAKYFDKSNWLYYTRENFDLLYPSYGDSYPMFNGAIGMTYEQGGLGKGIKITTPNGDLLTLKDRWTHHYITGLSTVEIASMNQQRIVDEFKKYFDAAKNPQGQYKTFIVSAANNTPNKIKELLKFLDKHQIRYAAATGDNVKRNVLNYFTGKNEQVALQNNDILISSSQPQSTLVKVFFNPKTALADSVTYDATAWALPYQFGVQMYAATEKINVDYSKKPTFVTAEIKEDKENKTLAYICRWQSVTDVQFLTKLWKAGIQVRFAEKPITLDKVRYEAGTLFILRGDNAALGEEFDTKVMELAKNAGQNLAITQTGFVETGVDLGSDYVRKLKAPKIAVVSGTDVNMYSFGQIWHYFDDIVKYPITNIDAQYFSRVDLSAYNVLILPDGNYSLLGSDSNLEKIKAWVKRGGRLVANQGANSLFANNKDFHLLKVEDEHKEDDKNAPKPAPDEFLKKYGDRYRNYLADQVQGSIYEVQLDNTHPLAFGYNNKYFTLKFDNQPYQFSKNLWNVGVIRENAYIDGFAGKKAKDKMKNTLVFGCEEVGGGQVMYLLEDVLFRNSWQNGFLLFGNATFVVGQ